jgi:hypothetical protein
MLKFKDFKEFKDRFLKIKEFKEFITGGNPAHSFFFF